MKGTLAAGRRENRAGRVALALIVVVTLEPIDEMHRLLIGLVLQGPMASGKAQDASFCAIAGSVTDIRHRRCRGRRREGVEVGVAWRCIHASAVEAEHHMGRNERRVGRERDNKTLQAEFSA